MFKKIITPIILALIGIFFLTLPSNILWLAFFMASAFTILTNFFNFGKRKIEPLGFHNFVVAEGIAGYYDVDSTEFYGMHIRLLNQLIFIDCGYEYEVNKAEFARYLFTNKDVLEINLDRFINDNEDFKERLVLYINIENNFEKCCYVRWDPYGECKLVNLQFLL